jgi:hypothetical protein
MSAALTPAHRQLLKLLAAQAVRDYLRSLPKPDQQDSADRSDHVLPRPPEAG